MANDLITLEEARTAVNLDSTSHDGELALWIAGVSRRIDDLCGPVVAREVVELHDGGGSVVRPNATPVSSVSSVVEYDDTDATTLTEETNDSKPADGFLLERLSDHNVMVRRRQSGSDARFASGRRNVKLTFDAGRYADTASVDDLFKLVATLVLRRLWKREQGAWAVGGNPFDEVAGASSGFFKVIDPTVVEFLSHEMHGPAVA